MGTNNLFKSDLNYIHNVVQNTMIGAPKEIIISTLKDYFSQDTYYHYVKDEWGYAKTNDHTNLPLEAGLKDDVTTRLFIGENFRYDVIEYPCILVKHGGGRSVPLSINREQGTIEYENRKYEDGYGNSVFYRNPKAFVTAGAWEGSLIIDVMTRSLRSRDDLVEQVGLCFQEITYNSLERAGVSIKPGMNWSATNESDDRNDKLFRQSITLEIRTEWRREIPVGNILEIINFSVEFGALPASEYPAAQNLTIHTDLTLLDIMNGEIDQRLINKK